MTDEVETRHVVRLACGHEALQVVAAGEAPTPVGEPFQCQECRRSQPIMETFEVDP
ncbi:MAG TPA: hypothetical protein VMU14_20375 [Acidimicrobiales bacterium]|nr:hypothetical protein [Acidimicrobiales bacterium]